MAKGWSVLFAVMMAVCFLMWVVSPFVGWSPPPGVSTHAPDIDRLYYIILGITGFFFVLTEALLVTFMWKYAGRPGGQHTFGHHAEEKKVFWTSFFKHIARPVSRVLHNQHRVELAWTLVPAAILLYIAFAQVGTWADAKYKSRMPAIGKAKTDMIPVQAAISARQFEWRIRYPSLANWKKWQTDPAAAKSWERGAYNLRVPGQQDDVHVANELHVIKGRPAVVYMSTLDVIHSFNVPVMRVKQDALPGRVIPVWFTATRSNTTRVAGANGRPRWVDGGGHDDKGGPKDRHLVWEIACAELCGWGHYRMIGRVFVHDTPEDFADWLGQAEAENNRHAFNESEKAGIH